MFFFDKKRCFLCLNFNSLSHISGGPGLKFSVDTLLPRIAFKLRAQTGSSELENLKIVHRLDKAATGAMLISRYGYLKFSSCYLCLPNSNGPCGLFRNEESHSKLTEAFSRHWIRKSYLCITSGIPRDRDGIIDRPLIVKKVGDNFKVSSFLLLAALPHVCFSNFLTRLAQIAYF